MTDEFYLCEHCGMPEPGWKHMMRIKVNGLSADALEYLHGETIFDEDQIAHFEERLGRKVEADEVNVCNNCGKIGKGLMYASWDPSDDFIDDMDEPEQVK